VSVEVSEVIFTIQMVLIDNQDVRRMVERNASWSELIKGVVRVCIK
jgi:hypothetical protein